MDTSAIFWTGRLAVAVAGVVLLFGAVRLLGRARAAANWPTAPAVSVAARPAAYLGIGLGLVALATAAALSLGALVVPDSSLAPHSWRGWLVGLGGALIVLGIGGAATGRLVARAELTALIRTPPRTPGNDPLEEIPAELSTPLTGTDPVVPSGGQPGWVYRDPAGDWYLAVATEGGEQGREPGREPGHEPGREQGHEQGGEEGGRRLVRLPDFTLVPLGRAGSPLTLVGSVELSVWPVEERPAAGGRPAVADPHGRSGVPPH
jgi:hypothetical protein